MKIILLELQNYIGIYNGAGLKKITIDFTKSKNKFIMITGKNGSGKSTIMNTLHPFSDLSVEDTSKSSVRPGRNGYKEIHYDYDGVLYFIKHFYTATKTGHSGKSYIVKRDIYGNETELNPNGNSSSFLEVMSSEFGIDLSFLKLGKLGQEVQTFTKMKASERKNYMANLLSDIDIYTKYFKKVNSDARTLRVLISSVSEKLNKLDKIENVENSMKIVTDRIASLDKIKRNMLANINRIDGRLNIIDPDGMIYSKYKQIKSDISRLTRSIESLNNKLPMEYEKDLNTLNKNINDLERTVVITESNLNRDIETKLDILKNINELHEEIADKNISLNSILDDSDITDYVKILSEYKEYVRSVPSKYTVRPKFTRDELLPVYGYIRIIGDYLTIIRQYTYTVIELAVTKSVSELENILTVHDSRKDDLDSTISRTREQIRFLEGQVHHAETLRNRPKDCTIDTCPFILESVKWLNVESEIDLNKNELVDLQNERLNIADLHSNMYDVMECKKSLEKMFEFILENDMERFTGSRNFIIDSLLNKSNTEFSILNKLPMMVEHAEEYEQYIEMVNVKIPEVEERIDGLRQKEKMINSYKNDITKLQKRLSVLVDVKLPMLNEVEEKYKNDIENNLGLIDHYTYVREILKQKYELEYELGLCNNDLDGVGGHISTIEKYKDGIKHDEAELIRLEKELKPLLLEKDKLSFNIREIRRYTKEKEVLSRNFNQVELVKNSLSSTKGIPLIFVEIYLQETRDIANRLLDLAFNGEFMIDNFEIDDRDFNIPCIGKGERNDDISNASTGEKAIITMALSFAMIQQNSSRYNILTLDEMDANLDIENRANYLEILDSQMRIMGVEQVILISHNNAFETYDCDVIALKSDGREIHRGMNVIFDYNKER